MHKHDYARHKTPNRIDPTLYSETKVDNEYEKFSKRRKSYNMLCKMLFGHCFQQRLKADLKVEECRLHTEKTIF